MRLFKHLPIIPYLFILLLIAGCSSGGDDNPVNTACSAVENPAPPTPFDDASRLVSAKAAFQREQCKCAVKSGAYACVADCEADLFKLEPYGDSQCMRDIFTANPLDASAIDCEITELERLSSCYASASCAENVIISCADDFETRLAACPTGPATSGDSFSIDLASNVDIPAVPGTSLNLPDAKLFFSDDNFYPGAFTVPLSNLPTFSGNDVQSLFAGTLSDVAGTYSYNYDITDFTVTIDPVESYKYNYTTRGTFSDAQGGDLAGLDGLPFAITVKYDINASPDSTTESPAIRRAQWNVTADYTIEGLLPGNLPLVSGVPTQLLAKDSFFEAQVDACGNLPGNQLAAFLGESQDANYDALCRCAPDEAAREQCQQIKQAPRNDCLAQLVDIDPVAAEVTECLIEELDDDANLMAGQSCCINPGDTDCLSSPTYSSNSAAFGVGQASSFCLPSAAARASFEAVLFCMGPPPAPPADFSTDPAVCDNVNYVVSGAPGDFMVVTQTQLIDPGTGLPYPRHYLTLDLAQLTQLASFDAAQPLMLALYALDAGTSPDNKDVCATTGIVSIALDGGGTPPDFGSISAGIQDTQDQLEAVPGLISGAVTDMEAYVAQLYTNHVCPTFDEIIDAGLDAAPFPLDKLFKNALLDRLGC